MVWYDDRFQDVGGVVIWGGREIISEIMSIYSVPWYVFEQVHFLPNVVAWLVRKKEGKIKPDLNFCSANTMLYFDLNPHNEMKQIK